VKPINPVLWLAPLLLCSCRMPEDLAQQPPRAREFPLKHRHHGVEREDPWHWLRERENPRVLAHLQAENAHTAAVMAAAGDLPERLFRELVGRIEEANESPVYPEGDYLYQSRIAAGQDYRAYYRKPKGGGEWQLYFDANAEASGKPFFDLGLLDVSPDGRTLAYAVDLEGDESHILRFRDLASGLELPPEIPGVSAEGEWDASGRLYYYITEDETRRPYRIFRYAVGGDPAGAERVHEERDPQFYLGIDKSQDERFLFAVSESKETTEVAVLAADDTAGRFTVLFPRRTGVRYWVEHLHGDWLVRTNEDALDYRLLAVPAVPAPDMAQARELVPARAGVRLDGVLPLRDHLVLFERENGVDRIRVRRLGDGAEHMIAFADPVHHLEPAVNAEFDTAYLNFTYSSPVRPASTWRYHLGTRGRELLRQVEVPSGHDPDAYEAYRIEAVSRDGTRVPMTVCHRRGLPRDGSRPAYLYGYGAYGLVDEDGFRVSALTWLERGFTVAIAHVRGGGLLGEQWHRDGKLGKKQNSFDDFIACAELLVAEGYTRPERLVIEGGSAGGLLVGAALNLRPELFRAALAAVPFVDIVNTMLDPSLPLTTFEYEEWGNPEDPRVFERLMAYAPYENVRPAAYPALLVTAGFNDPRVPYWEAAKWVARLRAHHTGPSPILLKTQLEAGHMGASGRYDAFRETAFEQAFLLSQVYSNETSTW